MIRVALAFAGLLLFASLPVAAASAVACQEALAAIVVVGPYSGGLGIVEEARNQGLQTVGVVSGVPLAAYDLGPVGLDRTVVHNGNVSKTTEAILAQGLLIKAVLAGAEWDPVLADQLRIGLARSGVDGLGNTDAKTWSRRDKAHFVEEMQKAAIPVPTTVCLGQRR